MFDNVHSDPWNSWRNTGCVHGYVSHCYIDLWNADSKKRNRERVGMYCHFSGILECFVKQKNMDREQYEMECAAVQAMCNFRNLNAYFFFTSGDLLDAPEWDARMSKKRDTQHDPGHFDIALELARYVAE